MSNIREAFNTLLSNLMTYHQDMSCILLEFLIERFYEESCRQEDILLKGLVLFI